MQSNGGVTSPQVAVRNAASTLLSGPAAGPVAGVVYTRPLGLNSCITVDMGGTSFDVALVRDGKCPISIEGWVERYRLALPALDIHTIGAGGGSIGWIDEGGLLRMGPRSAGAEPGPACYGKGGEHATCSDADLVLGYLNPDYFLGGKMKLDAAKATQSIETQIAKPMGLSVIEAAAGMYQVINVNMANGIRQITVKRGIDPREFALVVAGGAGPVHAGQIALELEIPLIIVPKESSTFCAGGMLLSDLKHDFVRTRVSLLSQADVRDIAQVVDEMMDEGRAVLAEEGVPAQDATFVCSAEMRYVGQYHEIAVPFSRSDLGTPDGLEQLKDKLHDIHDTLYGYSLKGTDRDIELINIRVTAVGITEKPAFKERHQGDEDSSHCLKGRRSVYLPGKKRMEEVNIYDGEKLACGNKVTGPAIVEQVNTTIVVLPEFVLVCDRLGSYVMCLKEKEDEYLRRSTR